MTGAISHNWQDANQRYLTARLSLLRDALERHIARAKTGEEKTETFLSDPVDWVNLEPVVMQIDSIMLGARSSHPNAGKLFIDFLLSQQGQEILQSNRRPVLRNGVDPDPPRLIRGFKRVVLHPDRAQAAQESLKLYREIFALQ
jgi:ABC-type Fe3+ transport system substrate-binding protein